MIQQSWHLFSVNCHLSVAGINMEHPSDTLPSSSLVEGSIEWIKQQLENGLSNDEYIQSYGVAAFKCKSTGAHLLRIELRLEIGISITDPKQYLFHRVPSLSKYHPSIIIHIRNPSSNNVPILY